MAITARLIGKLGGEQDELTVVNTAEKVLRLVRTGKIVHAEIKGSSLPTIPAGWRPRAEVHLPLGEISQKVIRVTTSGSILDNHPTSLTVVTWLTA